MSPTVKDEPRSIESEVMRVIRSQHITMRPRAYFELVSVFAILGFVGTFVFATFMTSLLIFSLRQHGPMGEIRFEYLLSQFPWWAMIMGGVGGVGTLFFWKRFSFSYRYPTSWIVAIFLVAVMISGLILDRIGLSARFSESPVGRRFFRQELLRKSQSPRPFRERRF